MRLTFKYRIYPTRGQETILNKALDACRWVYNETLATRTAAWGLYQINVGHYDCTTLLPFWKKTNPELKNAFSQCLQNAQKRVDLAFQAFFRRVKASEKPGYPRFRSADRYDSITYPQYGVGARLDGQTLVLSKIGSVRVQLHRPVDGTIKTVTLRRTATGKWFAAFSCDEVWERIPPPATDDCVGIDLGLEHFAFLSNGEHVKNPRLFKHGQDALAKAQRKLSKAEQGSDARKRHRKIVARVHERIRNRRTDFAHQLSRKWVNRFSVICMEDLNVRGMLEERKYSKSIADAAWSQLVQFTAYKAEEAGHRVILVDPRGTSQRCSSCGTVVPKDIAVRVHHCPHCGLHLRRDHNSALEIKRLGLQSLATAAPPKAPHCVEAATL
jgi:putative transposase